MKKRTLSLLAAFVCGLFTLSCEKTPNENGGEEPEPQKETVKIYAVGYESNAGDIPNAVLWEGSEKKNLTDGAVSSIATSVCVDGKDVYVVGCKKVVEEDGGIPGGAQEAIMWFSGGETLLSDGGLFGEARKVFLSGDKVYIIGSVKDGNYYRGVMWENSNPRIITGKYSNMGFYAMYISGQDTCVGGAMTQQNEDLLNFDKDFPQFTQTLDYTNPDVAWSGITFGQNGAIYCINGDEGNVYMCGVSEKNKTLEDGTATNSPFRATVWKYSPVSDEYWKDAAFLTDGTTESKAFSLIVSGTTYYAVGFEKNAEGKKIAKLWETGKNAVVLSQKESCAYCITKVGEDIFVGGFDTNDAGKRVAVIWKNGEVFKTLSDGANNSEIRSFIIEELK